MTPEERYKEELRKHNWFYEQIKPVRSFETDKEFEKIMLRWELDKAIDAPNKPGYVVANND